MIPIIQSADYSSPLELCNQIQEGKISLPVVVECGKSEFTLRNDNFHGILLGCLMASCWGEGS